MKSSSHGISPNVVQNVRVLLVFCFFVFVGFSSSGDEGRDGRREALLNQEARVGASYQKKINCYRAVLQIKYQVADGTWREVGL